VSFVCAPLLAGMLVAASTFTPTPTQANNGVVITIGAVLASNSGQEFDPRLVTMHRQFRTLFPYTSYRLVKQEQRRVMPGTKASFEIPGGRYLVVTPSGLTGERVSLRVMLLDGTRPVVDTLLTLRRHATFLVGGPRHQQGVLIISIGADTVPLGSDSGPVEPVAVPSTPQ
jgi:hypothetical protein